MPATLIQGGCVNDAAYIDAATKQANAIQTEAAIQAAIQAGLLIWQAYSQGIIADLRQELADRRMKMAEDILAHATIGWAQEAALVGDVMGTSEVGAEYSIAGAADATVEEAWGGADASYDAIVARMGLPPATACEDQRMGRGMATVKTDLYSHMMRAAESRAIAINDRRFSRQLTVLGMGRGFLDAARSMGALSVGREAVRGAIMGTINSALSLWGYQDTRWQSNNRGWGNSFAGAPRIGAGENAWAPPGAQSSQGLQINLNMATPENYEGSAVA